MDQSTAEDALKKLEPLVGHWRLTATPPGGPPWPGEGRAIFEWHDSGAHLVERTTVDIPGVPDGLSIIGCDPGNGTYFQLDSDDRGVCRAYEMSIGDSEWRLWREGAPIAQRFTGDSTRTAGQSPATARLPRAALTTRPTSTSPTPELSGSFAQ